MIEWKKDFEIGIPSADYEHRKLVELANELHEQARDAASPEAAAAALARIASHFTAHFSVEEEAMQAIASPDLDGHRRDHQELLARIDAMLERLGRGEAMTEALAEEMELWLVRHFHTWDISLYHILDRASSAAPPVRPAD